MSESTRHNVIKRAVSKLVSAGIEEPLFNAQYLLAHVLGQPYSRALRDPDGLLTDADERHFDALIARRMRRETYARIVGKAEFYGLWFGLNEATLEPRTDSELLVHLIVRRKKIPLKRFWRRRSLRVLDLGTGSGCLLLSILSALPQASGVGTDVASRAVDQARINAIRLGLRKRSRFLVNDWDVGLTERFDIVVSNPPNVPREEMPKLMPAVRDHDPYLALEGGGDGLEKYRRFIPHLPQRLKKGGLLVLEVGSGQARDVEGLLKKEGFCDVVAHRDARNTDRCLEARWEGTSA